jgi:hypothetical protein
VRKSRNKREREDTRGHEREERMQQELTGKDWTREGERGKETVPVPVTDK